jgi:hypothetical protein
LFGSKRKEMQEVESFIRCGPKSEKEILAPRYAGCESRSWFLVVFRGELL